jgi:hypothetical protein
MAVAVTNSTIIALNTSTATTRNVATADADAGAEVFTITPTRPDGKMIIVLDFDNLVATAAADDNATFSIAAGDFWAAEAITGTITKSTKTIIQVETGKVLQNDGTILLTLTPSANDKLKSNHAAAVEVFELI